jgi:hypothetical protein
VQIFVYPERLYGIPNFYRESIACNIGPNEVSNHTLEVIIRVTENLKKITEIFGTVS